MSVFIPIPKKGNAKECSNYLTIALISHISKVMLKIVKARLQQYMNLEHSDVQAGFRKDRVITDQIANIHWIIEKAREFQKNIYFCFIDYTKAFVWITTNCGKFLKRDKSRNKFTIAFGGFNTSLSNWCASQVAQTVKNLPTVCFDPWVGKILWRRKWQPTTVFLPGQFHE